MLEWMRLLELNSEYKFIASDLVCTSRLSWVDILKKSSSCDADKLIISVCLIIQIRLSL